MTLFATLGWLATVLTAAMLVFSIGRERWLLAKPSIWLLIAHHVIIQWAAALSAERIFLYLPHPWTFALLVHGFALIGLGGSLLTARASAAEAWERVARAGADPRWTGYVAILGITTLAIIAYYFRVVPFEATGLYAILYDPANAAEAREESLKLVSDPIVRYGYSCVISVFGPLLVGLLVARVSGTVGATRRRALAIAIVGVLALLVAVTLTGARSYAATLLITLAVAVGFRVRFRARYLAAMPLGLVVLAVPTVLTIVREGISLDLGTFLPYMRTFLLERVFYGPLDTGVWYAHYAQTHGFVGVAAVPKLATLFAVPAVNMPNTIGLLYTEASVQSVHANTGFVFAYYAYFGVLSFPATLMLLWSIDSALWVLRRLSDTLLAATIPAVAVAAIGFIAAEFTTVLVTHGFALLLAAAWLLDREPIPLDSEWLKPAPRSAT